VLACVRADVRLSADKDAGVRTTERTVLLACMHTGVCVRTRVRTPDKLRMRALRAPMQMRAWEMPMSACKVPRRHVVAHGAAPVLVRGCPRAG
jgi:hypothetical protein